MQRKQRLAFKQPEIEKCLASVKLLAAQKEEGTEVCGGVGGGYLGRVGLAGRSSGLGGESHGCAGTPAWHPHTRTLAEWSEEHVAL